jgi:hypothetical protein
LIAYSGAADIALALLPWKLFWPLNMNRKEKLGIIVAMSMGILSVQFCLLRQRTDG